MPRYDYRCDANGRTVEVSHGMSETVRTWGELCERAGIPAGATPPETPVERAVSLSFTRAGGGPSSKGSSGPCGPSCGCHPR
jgi:hypothetical protein